MWRFLHPICAGGLGLGATLCLLLLMMALVNRPDRSLDKDVESIKLDYISTAADRRSEVEKRERTLPEEPEPTETKATSMQAEEVQVQRNQAPQNVRKPSFLKSGGPTLNVKTGFGGQIGQGVRGQLQPRGSGDGGPVPLTRVSPIYPLSARQRGIEGEVTVEFDISKQGTVINVNVVRSEPPGLFDKYVVNAVKKWKYRPQTVKGEAVKRKNVYTTLKFTLPNKQKQNRGQQGAG